MSHLAAIAANMSRCKTVAAERSRHAVDAANWFGRAAEAEEMSCHAANATKISSRTAVAWENVLRAGKDSYRRMRALVLRQMDQISRWARLQDDLKASFE